MAPLEASSGAATNSRQRPPSTFPRPGAGCGRLRYHPLAWGRQQGAVALGRRPVGTVLGHCDATWADQWRSRGFVAIARLDLASVDFGRFRPGAVGRQLRRVESILVKSISFVVFGPDLEVSSFGPSRPVGPESIWCKSILAGFGREL